MARKRRSQHLRAVAAVTSATAIVFAGGLALETAGAAAQTAVSQQQASQNWSGYVVRNSAGKSFSSVSGSWVEPSASANAGGQGYAAFWVGLGGASNQSQSLEQVGTAAQVNGGQTTYYAWYELLPAAQVALPLTIHSGDHVAAKVTVNGTQVTISLKDESSGKSVTRTLQMSNPDTSSAEWIAEAPATESAGGDAQILPLADFGHVTFTGASATADGHSGSIDDPAWSATQVDLSPGATSEFVSGGGPYSQAGVAQALGQASGGASTAGLSDNGSSFTVSYSSDSAQSSSTAASDPYSEGYPGYGYSNPGYGYWSPGYGYWNPGYGYPGVAYGYPGGYAYLGL
jgi:Peptidase A4 family